MKDATVSQKWSSLPILLIVFSQVVGCLSSHSPDVVNGRIVGGTAAATNAAPFIVSMQQGGVHYCAGSILKANWVVTAAHCLTNQAEVLSTVLVAGSNNVQGTASTTQKRNVNNYVMHDLYTGGTSPYDIGLVYTKTAFQWTAAVSTVTLPASGTVPSGTADLYGWGSTSSTSVASYPTMLQVAKNLPIISDASCAAALGPKAVDLHTTNICTGPLTGTVSICYSDSGGPLIQTSSGKTKLIGIVSWGKFPCGQINSPSVYVEVSAFVSWIQNNQAL